MYYKYTIPFSFGFGCGPGQSEMARQRLNWKRRRKSGKRSGRNWQDAAGTGRLRRKLAKSDRNWQDAAIYSV